MTLNILAVDDETAILDLIEDSLSGEGHQIEKASSLAQARQCLAQQDFDVVIVDIGLSDGNGLDLVQSIRKQSSCWIIIVSGRGDVIDRIVGLELGADDYIVKPFHVRELRARILSVGRRLPAGNTHSLPDSTKLRRFGEYEIDALKRKVVRSGGEEQHLTTKEFDVLWALLVHGEKVVTREEIMRSAFGPGHEASGRPVDGLISRLREKLFPDGSGTARIKTIHGRGYQLSH